MENNKLYVFKINKNHKTCTQAEGRREIIALLRVAPIQFVLGAENEEYRELPPQQFTFETQKEAREFALKLLETHTFFFCELKEVEVHGKT